MAVFHFTESIFLMTENEWNFVQMVIFILDSVENIVGKKREKIMLFNCNFSISHKAFVKSWNLMVKGWKENRNKNL